MTLDAYRARFELPPDRAYLNYAAVGVLARPAADAVRAYLDERAGAAPGAFEPHLETVERMLANAAALVGTDRAHVETLPNTSYGIDVLAGGLDWRPGDRVAVPACEFPTNLMPWRALEAKGVAVDLVPHREGTFTVDAFREAVTARTRVVAVSWVQFLSGFRADLAALGQLARDHGALFCVDAIQGLGALRIDVEALGVDLLAAGGHKWLGGMMGGGLVYASDRVLAEAEPVVGWLGGEVDWDDFEGMDGALYPDARRLRAGTVAMAPLLALDASLAGLVAVGPDTLEAAVLENAARLAEGAARLGIPRFGSAEPAHASGIVTLSPDDPDGVFERLAAAGVDAALRSRRLRLSAHAHTRPDEIDRALEALAEAVAPRPTVWA